MLPDNLSLLRSTTNTGKDEERDHLSYTVHLIILLKSWMERVDKLPELAISPNLFSKILRETFIGAAEKLRRLAFLDKFQNNIDTPQAHS